MAGVDTEGRHPSQTAGAPARRTGIGEQQLEQLHLQQVELAPQRARRRARQRLRELRRAEPRQLQRLSEGAQEVGCLEQVASQAGRQPVQEEITICITSYRPRADGRVGSQPRQAVVWHCGL